MDNTALFNISYGLYVVQTTIDGKSNGCIINTCNQVANSPSRLAISLLKNNYTTELIEKSELVKISILDLSTPYEFIKNWGLYSGRDIDKYRYCPSRVDKNGIRYTDCHACSVLTAKVISQTDLGSHIMFIVEVVDAEKTSELEPLTYSYYHKYLKPKTIIQEGKKIKAWRCKICGYIYENETLMDEFVCPICGHDVSDFEPIYE